VDMEFEAKFSDEFIAEVKKKHMNWVNTEK